MQIAVFVSLYFTFNWAIYIRLLTLAMRPAISSFFHLQVMQVLIAINQVVAIHQVTTYR